MAESDIKGLLEKFNLDPKVIESTLANPKITAVLVETIKESGLKGCDKKVGIVVDC
jgi:hypothetical protein